MINKYRNASMALVRQLMYVYSEGKPVAVRGSQTKELRNECFTIERPDERVIFVRNRKDNIFAKIAETLWVLAGHNDITWLKRYLPRAPEWSDNGRTWRAAYGPRLRNWAGYDANTDQLANVLWELIKDPESRRAVISLWDPSVDYTESKDIPCNNWIHFLVRDGKLHMNIAQRSSDVIWGFSGINTFEFSVIQEYMANALDYEIGEFTYFISSLHLYEHHVERAKNILTVHQEDFYELDIPGCYPLRMGKYSLTELDNLLEDIFSHEHHWQESDTIDIYPPDTFGDMFFTTCANMLAIYNFYLNNPLPEDLHYNNRIKICNALAKLPDSDLKFAGIEYMMRKMPMNDTDLVNHPWIGILGTLTAK